MKIVKTALIIVFVLSFGIFGVSEVLMAILSTFLMPDLLKVLKIKPKKCTKKLLS